MIFGSVIARLYADARRGLDKDTLSGGHDMNRFGAFRLSVLFMLSSTMLAGLPESSTGEQKSAANADLPALIDEIAVELVNVDVVAVDRDGQPLRGLTQDDFELRVSGRPATITAFAEIEPAPIGEHAAASLEGAETAELISASPGDLPYLLVLVDGQQMLPPTKSRLVGDVIASMDTLLERSRGMMVATLGRRLQIDQTLARDPRLLESVLRDVAARGPVARATPNQLLRRIEQGVPAVGDEQAMARAMAEARTLMADIQSTAAQQRYDATVVGSQLHELIESLATLGGRTCVLLISEGLVTTPTEVALNMWMTKYDVFSQEIGVRSVEDELGRLSAGTAINDVIESAASNRVTFYVMAGNDSGIRAGGAETRSSAVFDAQVRALTDPKDSLRELARSTGGDFALSPDQAGHLLDSMISDLGHYYSLAFDPRTVADRNNRVRVRLRDRKGQVRHLQRFRRKTQEQVLSERAFAALHFDVVENPIGLAVELGQRSVVQPAAEALDPDRDRRVGRRPARKESVGRDRAHRKRREPRVMQTVKLRVPISALTLLPDAENHTGQMSLLVTARSDDDRRSPPVRATIPLVIPNAELLQSMSRRAGAQIDIELSPGSNKIAVALRDDVARTIATVNLVVDA